LRKELAKIEFSDIKKLSKAHLQLENKKLQMSLISSFTFILEKVNNKHLISVWNGQFALFKGV
jgi:hypothetical protein